MPFIAMIYIFFHAHAFKHQHSPDTQQDLLFEAVLPVASIKGVCNGAVVFGVHLIVCVQEVKGYSAYIDTPDISMHNIVHVRNVNDQLVSILIKLFHQGQGIEVLCLIIGDLLSVNA